MSSRRPWDVLCDVILFTFLIIVLSFAGFVA